jgi:AraC-like DNA-binding protein
LEEALNINYNLQSVLDILGLVQGFTLGCLLLIVSFRYSRSTQWLGFYLLLFSLKLLIFIPGGLGLDQLNSRFLLLPFNFSWLLFSVFFVYTQKISIFSNKKTTYWVLYPGILSFVVQSAIYLLPTATKEMISQSLWYDLVFTFAGILYSLGIGLWNLKFLNDHRTEVENTFSQTEQKALSWAKLFLIYSLISSVVIHIMYAISPNSYYFKVFFSILDLMAIYWISINGVVQQNVFSSLRVKAPDFTVRDITNAGNEQKKDKYPNMGELSLLMEDIDAYMKNSEAFIQGELTIIDLADKLNVHPKKISLSINTIFNENFNTYVNHLRIEKAESLLHDEASNNFSMEGIGKEVGFHSKSAFYSAFKKVTGTTPNKYKERIA